VKKLKKTLIIVLALSLLVAGIAVASVVSSKHDMRDFAGAPGRTISADGATTTQVCVFCHHPHRGTVAGISSVLLWNINDAAKDYPTYASPSTNSTNIGGNVTSVPAAQYTLLCMGCHDGGGVSNTFAVDTTDGTIKTGVTFPDLGTDTANLGSTLAEDHPVDFDYPTSDGAAGLTDIQIATGEGVVGFSSGTTYPLYSQTMQCATCHDVHNGTQAGLQFMRGAVANSQICIDCHTAK
jgi:predicted CXXCH cytochrome family protein